MEGQRVQNACRQIVAAARRESPDPARGEDDENPTEEDAMSTLYDPTTGLLRDAATDASFSEWRWCVLRDATSQGKL